MSETRNSTQLCFLKEYFCKVTITGNQGVDVCGAGRERVPLSVSTNSVLWLASWVTALHGPRCLSVLPATYLRAALVRLL